MKSVFFYDTIIGRLGIAENRAGITNILFHDSDTPPGFFVQETHLIKKAFIEISEYFEGRRTSFDLPLDYEGTVFQKTVWEVLKSIPYGETKTYRQVAERAGNPHASRAVGMANNKNPLPLIIPCHRVIGSNGKLTGYAGGLDMKKKLLDLERI